MTQRQITKPVNLQIKCKKEGCRFEIDWTECVSIEFAKNHFWGYNEAHADKMQCIHDYEFVEVVS